MAQNKYYRSWKQILECSLTAKREATANSEIPVWEQVHGVISKQLCIIATEGHTGPQSFVIDNHKAHYEVNRLKYRNMNIKFTKHVADNRWGWSLIQSCSQQRCSLQVFRSKAKDESYTPTWGFRSTQVHSVIVCTRGRWWKVLIAANIVCWRLESWKTSIMIWGVQLRNQNGTQVISQLRYSVQLIQVCQTANWTIWKDHWKKTSRTTAKRSRDGGSLLSEFDEQREVSVGNGRANSWNEISTKGWTRIRWSVRWQTYLYINRQSKWNYAYWI